jgi:hypothetical protein
MEVLHTIKIIRCAQVKILSRLLSSPLNKLSIYIYTEFDKMFQLDTDENENFDLAWTMLKEEGVVYTDIHEMGIKTDALPFATHFVKAVRRKLYC